MCDIGNEGSMNRRNSGEASMEGQDKSFAKRRKEALEHMSAVSVGDSITKNICFENDEVPGFLDDLDAFENEAKKTDLVLE